MAVLNFLNAMDRWSLMPTLRFLAQRNKDAAMAACMKLRLEYLVSIVLTKIERMMTKANTRLLHLMGWEAISTPKHM